MNGLKHRIERIQEQLSPEPPTLTAVIFTQRDRIEDPGNLPEGWHLVGQHALVMLLGGTPHQRRKKLTRMRRSGVYDAVPTSPTMTVEVGGDGDA